MIEFFKDIFEYHLHFNQKLIDVLAENSERISPRTMPLICHMINAHQIWNSRIQLTASFGVLDSHTLENCKQYDQKNYHDSLKILSDFDLGQVVAYKNTKGLEFENTVQQILFHIANHHTHHRAQINSDLRLAGVEPLAMDYIFYKR